VEILAKVIEIRPCGAPSDLPKQDGDISVEFCKFNGNGKRRKIAGVTFSYCVIESCNISNCILLNCTVIDCTIMKCEIINSEVFGSFIDVSKFDNSKITESTAIFPKANACEFIGTDFQCGEVSNSKITFGTISETKLANCKCRVMIIETFQFDDCEFMMCAIWHTILMPKAQIWCSRVDDEERRRFCKFIGIISDVAKFNGEYTDISISLAICCAFTIRYIQSKIPDYNLKEKFISNAFRIEYAKHEMDMIKAAVFGFASYLIDEKSFIRKNFPTLDAHNVEFMMTIGMYNRGTKLFEEKKFDEYLTMTDKCRKEIAEMKLLF
jgi:hypothetical protein